MNARVTALLCVVAFLAGSSVCQAQITNQTFQLHAGWNSIWVELDPTNRDTEAVFSNLPVVSVWTYLPNAGAVEFIRDQNETAVNQPGWLAWFPTNQPEAFLTSLFAVQPQHAYLVKLATNAAPTTFTITGRPSVTSPKWVADSYNLLGFPVNPAAAPSFDAFFSSAQAHAGQPIYRLSASGQWLLVSGSDLMQRGEAYWVYSHEASKFQGPLGLELSTTELDYAAVLNELTPQLRNSSSNSSLTVFITDLGTGANTPLAYQTAANNQITWADLPAPYQVNLGPGEVLDLRLAMRRSLFTGTNYSSILEIKDDVGTRYLVAVSADKLLAGRSSQTDTQPTGGGTNQTLAGLWFGSASVTNVGEAHSANPNVPTPTRSPFDLRLLLHVTTNGQPRLLKEVIQMWQPSIFTNDSSGNKVLDKPGRYVLLANDSLVPQFQGSALRSGAAVGRRLSTVDFDFDGGTNNFLVMAGSFGVGQTASCTINLDPNFPTNPFKHKYHPDHDNLDANFQPLPPGKEEAFRITRQIQLQFSASDPAGTNASLTGIEYGNSILGGTYTETVSGLHRTNLVASGTFRLSRVSNSPVLNQ
jgi:hypothetical protein